MELISKKQDGFTFMEFLIVIAIIGLLAGILFPIFSRVYEFGLQTTAQKQAKLVGAALSMYAVDYDHKYLPSTNYGLPESDPHRMWQVDLLPLVKNKEVFIAPGSEPKFADTWADRGMMSIGYSSATALDKDQGCLEDQKETNDCIAFSTVASFDEGHDPSSIGVFAATPNGPTTDNYRGYEFSPYNGKDNEENPRRSAPLVAAYDLVKEMKGMPADAMKPIYCRYMSNGKDEGFTPVIYADGHAKSFSVTEIESRDSRVTWRFR